MLGSWEARRLRGSSAPSCKIGIGIGIGIGFISRSLKTVLRGLRTLQLLLFL